MMETHNARIQPKWRAETTNGQILREGETHKSVEEEACRDLQHLQEVGILKRRIVGCNEYEEVAELSQAIGRAVGCSPGKVPAMAQEKKPTGEDQYRFAVTTHDALWLENIFITSTGPLAATNQAVEQISTPEYEGLNGRGCQALLTGINVDENGEWRKE